MCDDLSKREGRGVVSAERGPELQGKSKGASLLILYLRESSEACILRNHKSRKW